MRRYVLKIDWRDYELTGDTTGVDAGRLLDLLRGAREVDDSFDSSSVAKMVKKDCPQLDLAILLADVVEPKEANKESEVANEDKGF